MHPSEWTTCADTDPMFRLLQRRKRKPSARKQRLFACACCRRIWVSLDACCRHAVEVAERYADGAATREALNDAHDEAMNGHRRSRERCSRIDYRWVEAAVVIADEAWAAVEAATRPARAVASKSTFAVAQAALRASGDTDALAHEFAAQAEILRDLVGDPFARSALDASWLQWNEGAVAKLARSIYTERAFVRMPILADALPEAGCRDEEILDHCRAPRPHHPGCWVLDLLLEQE